MDFICKGCGRYEYIPPTDLEKRLAIENLEEWLDQVQREPWIIAWLDEYESELMARLRKAIDEMLSRA
jgi:hypothetical protein